MSMTNDEAYKLIKAVAAADYDGSEQWTRYNEPCLTREQAEAVLRKTAAADYHAGRLFGDYVRKHLPSAIEVLGMALAAQMYLDELTECHRVEYNLDAEEA